MRINLIGKIPQKSRVEEFHIVILLMTVFFISITFAQPTYGVNTQTHATLLDKAELIKDWMKNKELASLFLTGQNSLDQSLRHPFSASGLAHLLAISGAQISFVLGGLKRFWQFPFSFILSIFCPLRARNSLSNINGILSVLVAWYLSYLFGFTGSLVRLAGLSSIYLYLTEISSLSFTQKMRFPLLTGLTFRLIGICFCWPILGNPFQSLSFLLSIVGAETAILLTRNSEHSKSALKNFIYSSALVGLIMTIICAPFISVDFPYCLFANVIAIPIVNFFITPLCMFITIIPWPEVIFPLAKFLDLNLTILTFLAKNSQYIPQQAWNVELFQYYLTGVLFLLWSIHFKATVWQLKKLERFLKPGCKLGFGYYRNT